jgi:hypothetical protein
MNLFAGEKNESLPSTCSYNRWSIRTQTRRENLRNLTAEEHVDHFDDLRTYQLQVPILVTSQSGCSFIAQRCCIPHRGKLDCKGWRRMVYSSTISIRPRLRNELCSVYAEHCMIEPNPYVMPPGNFVAILSGLVPRQL